VFGQGGLLDTAGGILEDLQSGSVLGLIGAAQKAGTARNTFKGKNLQSILTSETKALGIAAIQGTVTPGAVRQVANKVDGWAFPKAGTGNPNTPNGG
jgi:Zn-dependent alcohol dehydrogenase